jgi:hypothetical protein
MDKRLLFDVPDKSRLNYAPYKHIVLPNVIEWCEDLANARNKVILKSLACIRASSDL